MIQSSSSSSAMFLPLITSCFILYQYHTTITPILSDDAKLMERWDPTDIITQPFPIQVLGPRFIYPTVGFIVIAAVCVQIITNMTLLMHHHKKSNNNIINNNNIKKNSSSLLFFFKETLKEILFYTMMQVLLFGIITLGTFLSGASLFVHIHHTVLACLFFSALAFGYFQPPPLLHVHDTLSSSSSSVSSIIMNTLLHIVIGGDVLSTYYMCQDKVEVGEEEVEVYSSSDQTNRASIASIASIAATTTTTTTSGNHHNHNGINRYVMYTTLIVTVPFQILNILDHGKQIQRWPIPIIVGSMIGHLLGCIIGIIKEVSDFILCSKLQHQLTKVQ